MMKTMSTVIREMVSIKWENIFWFWKVFHSYQSSKFVCISYHQNMVATNAIGGNGPVKAWQKTFNGVEVEDPNDYDASWIRKPIIYNLIGLNLWVKITSVINSINDCYKKMLEIGKCKEVFRPENGGLPDILTDCHLIDPFST